MLYLDGRLNTCVLVGLAENDGDHLRVHQCASRAWSVKVIRGDGMRGAEYPFEPVIVLGSLRIDDTGRKAVIEAAHLMRASKAHIPPKLIWNKPGHMRDVPFFPVDPMNRYRVRPEVLGPLPDNVVFPSWFSQGIQNEPELLPILQGTLQKQAFSFRTILTGTVRLGEFCPSDDPNDEDAGYQLLWFRPGPGKDEIPGRLFPTTPGYASTRRWIEQHGSGRIPVTAFARPIVPTTESGAGSGSFVVGRWTLSVLGIYAASQQDFASVADLMAMGSGSPR